MKFVPVTGQPDQMAWDRVKRPLDNVSHAMTAKKSAKKRLHVHKFCFAALSISQFHLRSGPPRADPRELAFFLPWMANFRGWGLLSWQISRGGEENRGQMPRPPSTVQHFFLIAQSNSAIFCFN